MLRALFAVVFAVCFAVSAHIDARAADLARPKGPVVLTVHGDIAHTNRGALNDFDDAFFKFGSVTFDRAASFDLAMLEQLGQKTLTVRYDTWPKAYTFQGPLLRDVLKAVGALDSKQGGKSIKVFAIDGYGAEIPLAEIRQYDVLLALKADGKYLGLGGRGPTWVVYPRDDKHPALKSHDDAKWVWSAIRIQVE
ncbi:MAG: molybdopterin-dependent oxidoreductase [Ferrovibrio sp.]|uniref:molybdopterin-dependent oxidoreductase n=1 Tax=Ferrovibrio sp. TaxID=1917215 RepID=UPI0026141109|nr:molybdopterin-dependent oxidoreductase [Ferrovibrio sp.]MCW0232970.1 molybdopterin-dependent oxidoreductase [Ferrovibrio sp.]